MTKEEWIEYFELVYGRRPSRLEINQARQAGEIRDLTNQANPNALAPSSQGRTDDQGQNVRPLSQASQKPNTAWSYPSKANLSQGYPVATAQAGSLARLRRKPKLWLILTLAVSGFLLFCLLGSLALLPGITKQATSRETGTGSRVNIIMRT